MIFDCDQVPANSMAELLLEASARTGFTPAQIKALIECELDTDQLLDYITAVTSNRMN